VILTSRVNGRNGVDGAVILDREVSAWRSRHCDDAAADGYGASEDGAAGACCLMQPEYAWPQSAPRMQEQAGEQNCDRCQDHSLHASSNSIQNFFLLYTEKNGTRFESFKVG
jgi:hypothetical protein